MIYDSVHNLFNSDTQEIVTKIHRSQQKSTLPHFI